LITGGSRGLGLALGKAFAREGAEVAFTFSRSLEDAETAQAELADLGCQALAFKGSVADAAHVKHVVEQLTRLWGSIDVLVNNAGYAYRGEIGAMDVDAMRTMFETNVFGLTDITNRAVPLMKAQGDGDIINVASTSGMKGAATATAYSGSKWAVRGISQCWQAELRPHGIRVLCLCPSEVQTNFGGRSGRNNPNKLYAEDIAATIMAALAMPRRVLWPELAVFANNPWKED
jgi:3-oxoacyl-[acyl-carrier protein] reductase